MASAKVRVAPVPARGLDQGYEVVTMACLSMVLVFGLHYAFGVFFKSLSDEFGWSRALISGAFSLVWIVQGLLSVAMGGINDKLGPRLVLTVCGLLIGTGYLLMSGITAVWQLYLFYGVFVGAGLGGTFVPLTSTTARWFVAKRGLMTGIVTAGVGIGALIGPLAASRLIVTYHWRTAWVILGSIALIGVPVMAQFLRRAPHARPEKSQMQSEGWSLREAAASSPFWIAISVFFFYGFVLSAILLHLAPHATDLGYTANSAANLVATLGGASVIGKVLLGIAADRIGNQLVYIGSFVLMAISLLWLIPVQALWMLYAFAAVFGFAYGGLATAHSPLVAWLFGIKHPFVSGYIFDISHSYRLRTAICFMSSVTAPD
jgi:OFA family oxalate/formate antiporter-like MFS transporter